ncbi:ABC transporter ATP-binding protein [candidate division WOR_3 bacterium SM23_60]|uniref:ABC transporter ATP-binding protein n=1 Tax=candidate division WOR_3 bacterium SM23_60 TaxID=1703780 RepID=A0A0S8GJQ5_UNCW3|nr:MAG: ABC transporter ATP-binding protein [candidate division WOR_3 bacterium SM23_60]
MKYGYVKKVNMSFDDALTKAKEELKKEGFGILTTIDVQQKFKEKLNIDFPKYMILGACNPPLAHKAISAEWDIGLLLPCNVTVYEKDGSIYVGIMKPTQAMAAVENDNLRSIAQEVETKLKRVYDNI